MVVGERRDENDMWVMGREWPWQVRGTVLVVSGRGVSWEVVSGGSGGRTGDLGFILAGKGEVCHFFTCIEVYTLSGVVRGGMFSRDVRQVVSRQVCCRSSFPFACAQCNAVSRVAVVVQGW